MKNNFEKRFSHFYDYEDTAQLQSVKADAHKKFLSKLPKIYLTNHSPNGKQKANN